MLGLSNNPVLKGAIVRGENGVLVTTTRNSKVFYNKHKKVKGIIGRVVSEKELSVSKIGRNESCPCNSGLKFKKCCINN